MHGGAGTITRQNMTPELEKQYREKLEEALRAGHAILAKGGTSLDAVEAGIRILEDSPLFNAGKGAVFFATVSGLEIVDPSYFWTERRWKALQKELMNEKAAEEKHMGTVGA